MEIVLLALMLVLGLGLLLGPRIARRRRAPSRRGAWNGASGRTRSRRRTGATARLEAAEPAVAPVDEDVWDDDLEWVDTPAHAAPAPEPAAEPAPAPAPSGRTWSGGDSERRAVPAAVSHAPTRLPAAPAPALESAAATSAGPLTVAPPRSLDDVEPSGLAPARTLEGATAAPAARTLEAPPAAPTRTLDAPPAVPTRTLDAPPKTAAAVHAADEIDPEWTSGIDVPPPRIARGAAAFGAGTSPVPAAGSTRRGPLSRHPVLLVAAYATAGIALVVLGVSFVSSQSFRSTNAPAGEPVASVTPEPTAERTPVPTPTPNPTPAPTPDPAKAAAARAEKRARAAWLSERRSSRRAEGNAVAAARERFRAAARKKKQRAAARSARPSGSSGDSGATTPRPVATAPAPRPAPRPAQPPPCEFCIG